MLGMQSATLSQWGESPFGREEELVSLIQSADSERAFGDEAVAQLELWGFELLDNSLDQQHQLTTTHNTSINATSVSLISQSQVAASEQQSIGENEFVAKSAPFEYTSGAPSQEVIAKDTNTDGEINNLLFPEEYFEQFDLLGGDDMKCEFFANPAELAPTGGMTWSNCIQTTKPCLNRSQTTDELFGEEADNASDILEDMDQEQLSTFIQDFDSYISGSSPPLSPEHVTEAIESASCSPRSPLSEESDSGCSYTDYSPVSSPCLTIESRSKSSVERQNRRRRLDPESRRIRKRDQNKFAASRYRSKKKSEFQVLQKEMDLLQNRNMELQGKATALFNEIEYLKGLMREVLLAKGLVQKRN